MGLGLGDGGDDFAFDLPVDLALLHEVKNVDVLLLSLVYANH